MNKIEAYRHAVTHVQMDVEAWAKNCGCGVEEYIYKKSRWVQKEDGHAFPAGHCLVEVQVNGEWVNANEFYGEGVRFFNSTRQG